MPCWRLKATQLPVVVQGSVAADAGSVEEDAAVGGWVAVAG